MSTNIHTPVEDHTYENFGGFSRRMSKPPLTVTTTATAATTGSRSTKKPQPSPKPEGMRVTKIAAKFEPPKQKSLPLTQQQQQQAPSPSPQTAAPRPGPTFRAPPAGQTPHPQYSQVNRTTKGTSSVAADGGSPLYEEAVPVVPQKSAAITTNGHASATASAAGAYRPPAAEEESLYEEALPRVIKPCVDRSDYEEPERVISDRLPADEKFEEPLYAEAAPVFKDRLPAGEKPQFVAPPPPSHKPPALPVATAASCRVPFNDSEGLYEEAAAVCKQAVAKCKDEENIYDDGTCM